MDYIREFLTINFPLLIIIIGMIFVALYDYKIRKRVCSYILIILAFAFSLAVFLEIEQYGIGSKNIVVATSFAFLGYVIRPIVLCLFILLGSKKVTKKHLFLLIPIFINILIYSFALFIGTDLAKTVYYYSLNNQGTILEHHAGTYGLNYTSHFISLILLALLIIQSMKKIRMKHSFDSIAILTCSGFVIIAVLVETFTSRTGLLNNTIAISCMFYYLLLFNEMNRRDILTGLYDRKTFYGDESRFGKEVNGIIHVDVNGLKLINDNKGHEQGDIAIKTLANVLKDNMNKDMYAYRIGGDEFVILCIKENEQQIIDTIKLFKNKLNETPYSASFGHGMRNEDDDTIELMLKKAEIEMYNDKNNFYKINHIDRRRH